MRLNESLSKKCPYSALILWNVAKKILKRKFRRYFLVAKNHKISFYSPSNWREKRPGVRPPALLSSHHLPPSRFNRDGVFSCRAVELYNSFLSTFVVFPRTITNAVVTTGTFTLLALKSRIKTMIFIPVCFHCAMVYGAIFLQQPALQETSALTTLSLSFAECLLSRLCGDLI